MAKAHMGANVILDGHAGYFIADIHEVGNVNVIVGNGDIGPGMLTPLGDSESIRLGFPRPLRNGNMVGEYGCATHHMMSLPGRCYWRENRAVFVVPKAQCVEIKR